MLASYLSQKIPFSATPEREQKVKEQLKKINMLQQTRHPLQHLRERKLCLLCFYTTDQLKAVNGTQWVSTFLQDAGEARAEHARLTHAHTDCLVRLQVLLLTHFDLSKETPIQSNQLGWQKMLYKKILTACSLGTRSLLWRHFIALTVKKNKL